MEMMQKYKAKLSKLSCRWKGVTDVILARPLQLVVRVWITDQCLFHHDLKNFQDCASQNKSSCMYVRNQDVTSIPITLHEGVDR